MLLVHKVYETLSKQTYGKNKMFSNKSFLFFLKNSMSVVYNLKYLSLGNLGKEIGNDKSKLNLDRKQRTKLSGLWFLRTILGIRHSGFKSQVCHL